MGQRAQPLSCVKSVTRYCPDLVGEEGGADVKSAWSLYPGPHTCYNGMSNGFCQTATFQQIPKTIPQWGLRSATRPHERGIGSNRGSVTPR